MVDSLKVMCRLEMAVDLLEVVLTPLEGMMDLSKEDIHLVVMDPMVVEVDHMEEDIWEEILHLFEDLGWDFKNLLGTHGIHLF
jgi:hypothetical protein